MLKRFVLAFIGGWLIAGVAFAQMGSATSGGVTTATTKTATPTSSTGTSTMGGAFASLSPANQKIARALYDAQKAPVTSAGPAGATTMTSGTTADSTGPSVLSLDQIAQMKQSGQGWGNVFREMKSQGLVDAKHLGRVVGASSKHQVETTAIGGIPAGTDGAATASTVINTGGHATVVSASRGHGAGSVKHGKN